MNAICQTGISMQNWQPMKTGWEQFPKYVICVIIIHVCVIYDTCMCLIDYVYEWQ